MVHLSSATPAVCVVDDGESSAKETILLARAFWRYRKADEKAQTGPSVFARFISHHIFCPDTCLASAGACRSAFRWLRIFSSCPATLEFSTHRKRLQKTSTCQACRRLLSFSPLQRPSSIFCVVVIARRSKTTAHKIFSTTKLVVDN